MKTDQVFKFLTYNISFDISSNLSFSWQNELIFSLNGECKGIAAYHIPYRVFAVVDLYGQVGQVSVLSYTLIENIQASVISTDLDTCKPDF